MSNDMGEIRHSSRRDIPEYLTLRDVLYEADAASITTSHEEWLALQRYRKVLREHIEIVEKEIELEEAMQNMDGKALEQTRAEWQAAREKQRELYHCFCEMENTQLMRPVLSRVMQAINEFDNPSCGMSYRERIDVVAYRLRQMKLASESTVYRVAPPQDKIPIEKAELPVKQEEELKSGKTILIYGLLALALILFLVYWCK